MKKKLAVLIAAGALVVAALVHLMWTDAAPPAATTTTVQAALDGRTDAALEVLPGAESVTVHSADLGDLLFRASTPPGATVEPAAAVRDGRVTLSLTHTAVAGQATLHVYLNARVRWRLTLAGGGLEQAVDFGSGRLAGIELRAGAGRVDLALPRPEGTLAVSLAGGAGALAIHVPSAVPAKLMLDKDGSVGTLSDPGAVLSPTGWAGATDRLQIQAGGGIASITVDRH